MWPTRAAARPVRREAGGHWRCGCGGAGTPTGAASATHDDQWTRMLTGDGRMKAILVADDDAGTRDLLRGALATAVVDGAGVLRLLESVQPDLIVLDVT